MDSSEGYVILDVRTQEEYDQGHIPGAILIPDTEINAKATRKICDSFRISEEWKAEFKKLRPALKERK